MTSVTKQEKKIADELFAKFDKDKNGTLSVTELEMGIRGATGSNPTKKEIDQILNETGVDRGKPITKEQFTKTVAKYVKEYEKSGKTKEEQEKEIRQAFSVFDRNKNKMVEKKELSVALKNLGEKMTDAEVTEMFDAADKNGDGKINYEEFIALFTKDLQKKT